MLTFNHNADNNILFFLCQAHNKHPLLAKSSGSLGWVQGRRGGACCNRGFRFVSTFFKKNLSGVQKNKNACLPEWLNVAILFYDWSREQVSVGQTRYLRSLRNRPCSVDVVDIYKPSLWRTRFSNV
jgi:hypothetical protein